MPDFRKIAEAYGIRAATLNSYHELDNYQNWFRDNQPCLFNIMLPERSSLTPKIKWETSTITPRLDDHVINQVEEILRI